MNDDAQSAPSAHALRAAAYFEALQGSICGALEELEGGKKFGEERWRRAEGGGGRSRMIEDGGVFERAGVNTSAVSGTLPEALAKRLEVAPTGFYAAGVSLVLHPRSPMVPTVHANVRYFELADGDSWYGGGIDLTPFYSFAEDNRHFHAVLKKACDACDPTYYQRFKKWCDDYFFLKHRGETRGIGGVFFDYLRGEPEKHFLLVRSLGDSFLEAYCPIVRRRVQESWGEKEREWQLCRRGRYVEFNLLYDRGTLFGLESHGRTDSILMSLPPRARWTTGFRPEPGTREAELVAILTQPREWT